MKQFKALIVKEWQTHKLTILIPVWFTAGAVLITLVGMLINVIQGSNLIITGEMGEMVEIKRNLILWAANRSGISLLGFIGMVTAVILGDAMLNGGFKRRCEIFHLSQPVSYANILGAKYLLLNLSVIAQVLVLGLLGSVVGTAYLSNFMGVPFMNGLIGTWQGMIDFVFAFLFVSSLFWFFAGVFKRKSFFMGALILVGIQIATMILNKITGLDIPSLTGYILKMASMSSSIEVNGNSLTPTDFSQFVSLQWSSLLSVSLLLKVLYSAVLFAGGYIFYQRREIA